MECGMPDEMGSLEPYIIFELAGTSYGVASRLVKQIEMIEHITPMPNAPGAIAGVIFSRGQVIPAVNLRVRFGFESIPLGLRTRLIVVENEGRTVGLLVDSAREFVAIPSDAIQPPSEAISGLSGKYLEGIATLEGRIILILNIAEAMTFAEGNLPAPEGA
jgi:purine-binding chemotaxis protein CheW